MHSTCAPHFLPRASSHCPLQSVVLHPDYNPTTQENDLALVGLAKAVNASTVALNTLPGPQLPSQLAVAGWGYTQNEYLSGDTSISNQLM